MKSELEWEFLGVWPLDHGDYYIFQWRTCCGQYLITGSFYLDGRPSFDCYANVGDKRKRIAVGWATFRRARNWVERYAKGKVGALA